MKVKSEYIHEKGSGCLNEDSISVNGTLFGVFDGATSLDKRVFERGITGGYLASSIACSVFAEDNDSLINLAERANCSIYEKMVEKGVNTSDKGALWSTSAAVLKIERDRLNWVQTGDSLIIIIYEDGSYRLPANGSSQDIETLVMWKEIAPKTDKSIFEAIGDQIIKVRSEMNLSYGVLNGEDSFRDFLSSGDEPLKDVKHVLLFTDGLTIPSPSPDDRKNFDSLVQIYLKSGLNAVKEHVRSIESSDPECRIYPRFKCHDDIAAVALTFQHNSPGSPQSSHFTD